MPDSLASNLSCSLLLTSANVNALPWGRTHRADLRITPDHPVFCAQPYSFQYGGCRTTTMSINVPSFVLIFNSVLAKCINRSLLIEKKRLYCIYIFNLVQKNGPSMLSLSLWRFRRRWNAGWHYFNQQMMRLFIHCYWFRYFKNSLLCIRFTIIISYPLFPMFVYQ